MGIRIFLILILASSLYGESYLKSLYDSLDPYSVSEALAFYELYPETKEGKEALKRSATLLGKKSDFPVEGLVKAINRFGSVKISDFKEEELKLVEELASHLPNRRLKGNIALTENEMLALPPEEIDMGRALLLSQLEGTKELEARSYLALLDLMALQILAKVSLDSPPEEKIKAANRYIFEEMRFRFPPHSLYAKAIDHYTFLPTVMDNHLGVCLGVSALYLAIAERINLPLEIVTPPGHIYLRYRDNEKTIVIETTARGVNISEDHYLSLNISKLKERNKREVVGMTHVNLASIYFQEEEYEKAKKSYEKALAYMEGDPLVEELLAYCYLFTDKKPEGLKLLNKLKEKSEEGMKEKIVEDYLSGKVDESGIKAVFMFVDEKRESILKKQKKLQEVLTRFPEFRAGLQHLATTYLQLSRSKEAIYWLEKYHDIDDQNPVIEYYLSALYGEREDYTNSWRHLKVAEKIVQEKGFYPKTLLELRTELLFHSPEFELKS